MRGRDVKCFKLVKATQKPPSLLLEARLCLCFCVYYVCVYVFVPYVLVCYFLCFLSFVLNDGMLFIFFICSSCLCVCICFILFIYWARIKENIHVCLYMYYVCFCCCAQCECVITIFNWYLLGGFTMFVLSVFVPMSLCSMYQFSGTID